MFLDFLEKREETTDSITLTDEEKIFLKVFGIDSEQPAAAMREATYFTCIKQLSEAVAKTPLYLVQDTENGIRRATEERLNELLSLRPNPYMTGAKGNCRRRIRKDIKGKAGGISMALLSEKEKEQLNRVLAEYPNSEDLDLTAFIAEVIGITGVHTEEGWYNQNINDTHITFYFMSDEDIDFSEDTNENEEYYIQVDIWSKEDCFRLKKKVKKLLKKAGFTYFTGNDQYEVETGIYHKAARFYFSMNVED